MRKSTEAILQHCHDIVKSIVENKNLVSPLVRLHSLTVDMLEVHDPSYNPFSSEERAEQSLYNVISRVKTTDQDKEEQALSVVVQCMGGVQDAIAAIRAQAQLNNILNAMNRAWGGAEKEVQELQSQKLLN
jgi:hypothetical protein